MPDTHSFPPDDPGQRESAPPTPQPIHSVDEALNEVDRILHQMLLLAELSASDGAVDRDSLQVALERLQAKIDRIMDSI